MREIEAWKDITGFEGLYQVSSYGNVKRMMTKAGKGTGNYARPEKVLTQRKTNVGYFMVDLYKENGRKQFLVHRLVALEFVDNPNDLSIVNHIDEIKTNNSAANLEWCTYKHNSLHSSYKIAAANGKPVIQIDRETGKAIRVFPSVMQAHRETGIAHGSISDCVSEKRRNTAGGFIWKREAVI